MMAIVAVSPKPTVGSARKWYTFQFLQSVIKGFTFGFTCAIVAALAVDAGVVLYHGGRGSTVIGWAVVHLHGLAQVYSKTHILQKEGDKGYLIL